MPIDLIKEREFILEYQMWPLFPYLPVKNSSPEFKESDGRPKLGTMCATGDKLEKMEVKPIIWDFTIDNVPKEKNAAKILVSYNSMDELLDAGWIVD